jgi:hypothetical protein
MSAIEDPDSSSAAAGPDSPSDDLENWLSDLRTEVSADPAGWINEDPVGEPPSDPFSPGQGGTDGPKPSSGGRHRAAD